MLVESPNCNAFEGSNSAVGWGWVTHIAARHEVHVVTIGSVYDRGHPGGVAPEFHNVHPIRIASTRARKLGTLSDYVIAARRRRDEILARVRPDVVHSVEPGGWLGPRVFATDRVPYVLGPLNGGAALPSRAFMEAVLGALPVSQARAFFAGGPRKLAVTLFNEALFGNIPTSRVLARRAMAKARRILLATPLTPGAIPDRLRTRVEPMPLTGLDLSTFRPGPEPSAGPLRVLYAGRVVASKGLHLVIEALPRTRATLRIAGAAPPQDEWYAEHCRARARELGVADRVAWLGTLARAELVAEYGAADVLCMLSLWEPFGMTYIEAMACGTPVIGLAAGGVTEIVGPGTGWLLQPTSPDGVVDQLSELLARLDDDRDVPGESGARACALVEATYSWHRMIDRLEDVYAAIR